MVDLDIVLNFKQSDVSDSRLIPVSVMIYMYTNTFDECFKTSRTQSVGRLYANFTVKLVNSVLAKSEKELRGNDQLTSYSVMTTFSVRFGIICVNRY